MKAIGFDCANRFMRVCAINGRKKFVIEKETCNSTNFLLPAIDECIKEVDMTIDEVSEVVVGVGPGSWTGARVAVATALGLFSGKENVKLYSFNSFDMVKQFSKADNIIVEAYANFVFFLEAGKEGKCITRIEAQKFENAGNSIAGEVKLVFNQEIVKVNFQKFVEYWLMNKKPIDVSSLEPMYLKVSQAEEQLLKRMNNK